MNDAYRKALRDFYDRSDYERGTISNPFGGNDSAAARGLVRMRAVLDRLGNPHSTYPIVHVAGSKGKGSTCAFLSTILTTAGLRTGRYVSPHLHTLRERIAIDGESMTEEDFARSFTRVLHSAEKVEQSQPELGPVTAFEISTVMALEQFAHAKCDIAVIEVGLGGTWDATNIVDPAISVIALIDYEHTDILGDTLAEIAENKAGIIKPNRPVVSMAQRPEAMKVIRDAATRNQARLFVEGEDWGASNDWRSARFEFNGEVIGPVKLGLTGHHQLRNAGLAVVSTLLLHKTFTFDVLTDEQRLALDGAAIERGLAATTWPARFEVVTGTDGATIVIDGAHTGAAAEALIDTLDQEFPDTPVEFVFGMLGAKDIERMLRQLRRRSDRIAIVAPSNPRAMTLETMAAAAEAAGLRAIPETDLGQAIAGASIRAGQTGVVVVTGSLSFAAEARDTLGLARTERLIP
jgi:dihydrofolate synthase/folylpolyglutamate synthase